METPEFNNWFKMFTDGLGFLVIDIIYAFIPGIIILVGLGVMDYTRSSISIKYKHHRRNYIVNRLSTSLFYGFNLTMAILNMSYHGEPGAALRLKEVIGRIKKLGWLSYIGMLIVLALVGSVLALIAVLISDDPLYWLDYSSFSHLSLLLPVLGESIKLDLSRNT